MIWKKLGLLSQGVDREYRNCMGVYLEIFPGIPRRVIYVGTTTEQGFGTRPGDYWAGKDGYLKMKHYAFKATEHDDIYEQGMRVREGESREEYARRASKMWSDGIIWIPGNTTESELKTLWREGNWENHILQYYKNVELWGCIISDLNHAKEVESRIQIALGAKERLGYYSTRVRENWLGQQGWRKILRGGNYTSLFSSSRSDIQDLDLDDVDDVFLENPNRERVDWYFRNENTTDCPF